MSKEEYKFTGLRYFEGDTMWIEQMIIEAKTREEAFDVHRYLAWVFHQIWELSYAKENLPLKRIVSHPSTGDVEYHDYTALKLKGKLRISIDE